MTTPGRLDTLRAVTTAASATGSWAPHLSAIVDEHDPPQPFTAVRARLLALVDEGLVERHGATLDFSLTPKGVEMLDAESVR